MSAAGKTMNCEKYKEAITADPSESFENGAEHAALCAACSEFKAEIQALDAMIGRALRIDVPDLELPELSPVDASNGKVVDLPVRARPRVSTPVWLGIAASFALAAIIGLQFTGSDLDADQLLAREVLAHLDHESWALTVTDVAVSPERFSRVVNPVAGTMDRSIGLVSYARTCLINGNSIPHLVIQGKKGPITLLLMPDETVTSAVSLNGDAVNGVILPVGDGSIAIIGDREEELTDLQEQVVNAVKWRI